MHVVRFTLTDEQRDAFRDPEVPVELVVDHPEYSEGTPITGPTRLSLLADLALGARTPEHSAASGVGLPFDARRSLSAQMHLDEPGDWLHPLPAITLSDLPECACGSSISTRPG